MATNLNVSLIIKAIDQATGTLRRVTSNFGKLREAKAAADRHFASAGNIRNAAEGVNRFATAARAAISAPVSEFENFEAAMSSVKAKTKALTDGEFAELNATAKKLGATTRFTAEESANAMEFLAIAGFNASEQMKTVPTVLNLATAAGTDLARTSDVLSDVMGAFGKESGSATDVADVLATTMTNSNTTLETLFETMKLAGPQATDLGVSLQDVAVMAGVMGNAGIKGSLGGTALRGAMTRLVKPVGDAKKIMDEYNISVSDADDNFRGIIPVLKEVDQKTKGLGSAKRARIIAELFGVRGMAGASNILRSFDTGKFDELAIAIDKAGGSTKKISEVMMDNAKGATILMTSAHSGLMTMIGEQLEPTLTSLKGVITSVLQGLTAWVTRNPGLTKAIALTVGGVAALATALTTLMFTMAAFTSALGVAKIGIAGWKTALVLAGSAVKKLTAKTIVWQAVSSRSGGMVGVQQRGITTLAKSIFTKGVPAFIAWAASAWSAAAGVIAATWPIIAIAAAIAALIAVTYLVITQWDKLVAIFDRFRDASLKTKIILGVLLGPIVALLSPILAIGWAANKIMDNWEPLKTWFKEFFEGIGLIIDDFKKKLDFVLPAPLKKLLDLQLSAGSAVAGAIGDTVDEIGFVLGGGESGAANVETSNVLARTQAESDARQGTAAVEIKFVNGIPMVERSEAEGVDLMFDTGGALEGAT